MPAFVNAAPAAPTGISLTGSTKQINVKWTACPDYDYQYTLVQFGTASGGPWTTAGQTNGTSLEITGLSNNTTYWVRLAHVDSFGPTTLNYSTAASATTDNFDSAVDARIASASIDGARLVGQSVPSAALSSEALYAPLAVIGDVRNICRNPLGDRGTSGWTASFFTATAAGFDWATPSANAYKGQSCFTLDNRNAYYGDFIPVEFGEQFWASVMTLPRGGLTANYPFAIGIAIYNKDKTAIKWNKAATRTAATSGYLEITGSCVVDHVDAVYIQPWIQIDKPQNTATSGTAGDGYHFTNATWTRKNRGELIVDGTITGNHVAANSITADKIDTRNLSIKDAAGNVIFASGTRLEEQYINAGRSGNLLVNTENRSNEHFNGKGWATFTRTGYNYYTYNNFGWTAGRWAPVGTNAFVIEQTDEAGDPMTTYGQIASDLVPATAGTRYEASVYVQSHRARPRLYLVFYLADGTTQAGSSISEGPTADWVLTENGTARDLNQWYRCKVFGTAPANTVYARILMRKWDTLDGGVNSYCWWLDPYLGVAGTNQTTFTPYSPGAEWVPNNTVRADNKITSTNVSTYINSAAITEAYIGTITANKIDTRNLTIKDGAGNTILGAGVPLNQNLINLGFSTNMLKNTDNAANEIFIGRGWSIGGYTSLAGANSAAITYWTEQQRDGQNWSWQPFQANASVIFYDGVGKATVGNPQFVDIFSDHIQVLPSSRYELSARLATHRCQAELYALYYDRNGNLVQASNMGACNQAAGDPRNINTWLKVGGFSTSPSSATSVRFLWRRWLTWDGEANSYAWMLHPYFGRATDGQTTLSDYSPGGDWIPSNTVRPDNPITSGNIGTYMSTAAIGTAYIQDAAIGSAKIANAAVDTLRIAGESATVVRSFTNNTNYTGADGQQITVMDVNFTVPYDSKVLVGWSAKQTYTAGEKLYNFIIQLDGVNMYGTGQIGFGQDLVQMLQSTTVGPGTHNIKIIWGSSLTLYLGAQTLALWCSMR